MLVDVVQAEALEEHRLRLTFEDGVHGVVDVARLVSFHGVFEPLRDPAEFARVRIDPELGTFCWPSGADLAPETLYDVVTKGG
jgi:hypothetical protein